MRIIMLILFLFPLFNFAQKTDVFIKLTDASGQQIKGDAMNVTTIKQTDKAIKFDKVTKITDKVLKTEHIKKTNADIPFKESVTKPDKH